jgi:hypothetical protein
LREFEKDEPKWTKMVLDWTILSML